MTEFARRAGQMLGVDASDDNAVRKGLASVVLAPVKVARIPITALSTGEKDTGFNLPSNGVVLGCFVDVDTAEATATTKTIDVGMLSSESGGDADGFLDGVSTATAGAVKGTLASAGQTLGVLLSADESGAGVLVPEPYLLDGVPNSVTYTLGSAHTELVGSIIIVYIDFENA
jgi:hypothetical protein